MDNNNIKGLKDFLTEDTSLSEKVKGIAIKSGIDDSQIENAYKTYCRLVRGNK